MKELRTYLVSTLDPEQDQRDQKLLIRIKPLSQPNQKLELCALYAPQAIDPDHSIRKNVKKFLLSYPH
uniref:Uncharacterized protein n=1 Tax=Triticum urartu TaxID=4572 RepID=A0A8R7PDH4_TRIUA